MIFGIRMPFFGAFQDFINLYKVFGTLCDQTRTQLKLLTLLKIEKVEICQSPYYN